MRQRQRHKEEFQPEVAIATYQRRSNVLEHGKNSASLSSNRRNEVKKKQRLEPVRNLPPEKPRRGRRVQELLDEDDVTFINHHPPSRRLDVVLDSSSADAFSEDFHREREDVRMRAEDRRLREEGIRMRDEEELKKRSMTPPRTRMNPSQKADANNNCIDDFSLLGVREAFSNVPWFGDQSGNANNKSNNNNNKEAEDDEEIKYMERLRDTMLLVAGVGACGLALML